MAQPKQSAGNDFYEVVFRGKPKVVRAFLGGLTLGSGRAATIFYNFLDGIHHEGKAEKLAEIVGIRHADVHVVVDARTSALLKKLAKRIDQEIGLEIMAHRKIRSASLEFTFTAYAAKYDDEIMALLKGLPKELKLRGFKHDVDFDPSAKGVEAYASVHDFEANGRGSISGPVDRLVAAKKMFAQYPLIKAEDIELKLS